ncbi:MAG: hypothetical protein PHG29_09135 [Prolixibacteraceae bacterium]|jgi:hypothetical protein|nr:hypothetical protein [Prolixibacteraceae bacterium]NLO01015.1 hypothetical protein [Bacteroidales bacterium]
MTIKNYINRRHFIGTTAAAAGGLVLPANSIFNMAGDAFPSNKHFWYRRAANDPYIDTQTKNMAFGYTDDAVFMSEDNSHTWPHRADFWDAKNITFSHIFENGNVLFATRNRLYLSSDKLGTYREIIMKNPDGTDYLPHVPKNPEMPGWYFATLTGVNSWIIDGREIMVWGNYGNVAGGAVPINIYYSTDNGQTVKIAYAFGINPYRHDNGASGGNTGKPIGNPDNPNFCRHIHCVSYNPLERAFYACTGDGDRPEGHECKWLRGTYNSANDKWDWKIIIEASLNTRYKGGGINFVDGKLYWISDANGPEPHDRGLFCCDPADIANTKAHELLYQPKYECANMIIQDGVILAGHYATASPWECGIIYSPDMGKTWVEYDLKEYGPRSPIQFQKKNDEGWFRVDLRAGWIDPADVLFIKPK